MTRLQTLKTIFTRPFAIINSAPISAVLIASILSTGCATNYLTNSTEGTYGVPVTERTIPQRMLDRSIEHTAKINVYGLQENLQQNSRMSIDSFYSEVLLSGEVPTEDLKTQIEKVVSSMPDVRRVYNELNVSAARGYSSTVQDGYISSKVIAKAVAKDGVNKSQIKVVTNNGVVYVLGRVTPTQQSHLIDIANSTAGITELVLLTTVVNNSGLPIGDEDIMSESNNAAAQAPIAAPVVRSVEPTDPAARSSTPTASPTIGSDYSEGSEGSEGSEEAEENNEPVAQPSSSPYIDLYRQP